MRFENTTLFPGALFRSCIDEDRIAASVAVRITYDLRGGRTALCEEQPWRVSPSPWVGPRGEMPGDDIFYRGGTDILVFGSARARGDRPASHLPVSVEVGRDWRYSLTATGPRAWVRGSDGLVASAPAAVVSVPLTLEYAYGGIAVWDELPIPFVDNVIGRGFYIDEEAALGRPLPQLEDARTPIRRWDARPEPVGVSVCPPSFGPRLRRFVEFHEDGLMKRIDPRFFNAAFPEMIAPRVGAGDRVRVEGVLPSGPLEFAVPASDLAVQITIHDDVLTVQPKIDQIGIDVEAQRIFVSHRYPFRYRVVPRQKRSCKLYRGAST